MPPKEKRRYITYRVDTTYLRDKFLAPRVARSSHCAEGLVRLLKFARFCVVCSASLFLALAPWMLATVEMGAVLLIYFLGVSKSLFVHEPPARYHFSFVRSLEDVVGLSCTRAVLLSVAYATGIRYSHRTYLYAAYLLCTLCFPYIVVKAILFKYDGNPAPAVSLLALTAAFCWVHVFAARRIVEWARHRYQMGLPGFGYPWDEGEEAWMVLRRPDVEEVDKCSDGGGPEGDGEDVPPESMADCDSKFVDVGGIKVHYKEVVPPSSAAEQAGGASGSAAAVGVVLAHGFGGGVFAWRHVMEPLAMQCQCRVIAFDRPAFGLTSRPRVTGDGDNNPYSVSAQAHLLLNLCRALGLQQVVLVAHADGCMLALKAASISDSAVSAYQFPPEAQTMHPSTMPGSGRADLSGRAQEAGLDPRAWPHASQRLSSGSAAHLDAGSSAAGSGQGADATSIPMLERRGSEGSEVASVNSHGSGAASRGYGSVGTGDADLGSMIDRDADSMAALLGSHQHQHTQHLHPGSAELQPYKWQDPHAGAGRHEGGWPGSQSGANSAPRVLGLVLLHPNLSGQLGPAFSHLLARSKLGRSILRPLLRSEIGEVANRRAWHNTDKLTAEVLELYKAPLRVEGWDTALIETTRLKREFTPAELTMQAGSSRPLPTLVVTGEHDRIVPPAKAESLCLDLPMCRLSVLSDCGHLSHEEVPGALLGQVVPFCGFVLTRLAPAGATLSR